MILTFKCKKCHGAIKCKVLNPSTHTVNINCPHCDFRYIASAQASKDLLKFLCKKCKKINYMSSAVLMQTKQTVCHHCNTIFKLSNHART